MKGYIYGDVHLSLTDYFICIPYVVWKYFVAKKFSLVMKPTKIYYTKNF